MGVNISKRYSYKSQPKTFKLFLNFLSNGPHKTTFGIFEILKISILIFFFCSASMLLAEIMVRCGLALASVVRPSARPSVCQVNYL